MKQMFYKEKKPQSFSVCLYIPSTGNYLKRINLVNCVNLCLKNIWNTVYYKILNNELRRCYVHVHVFRLFTTNIPDLWKLLP